MFWSALLLSIAALVVDYAVWRRRIRHWRVAAYRKAYAAFVLTTDLLPGIVPVVLALCRDNGTAAMLFAQWCFFAFLITVVPRMVFYLFLALRMPRIGALLAAASVAVLLVGATRGRHAFRTEEVVIRSERLPAGFDGFRIVQFSDTHIGTMCRPDRELRRLVDAIDALRPDLIVFSGDLVNIRYTELDSAAMRILGGLRAPYVVVSSVGNHDIGYYIKDSVSLPAEVNLARLIGRQRAMGWRVLDDASESLVRDGDTITVSGLSFNPALRNFRHAFLLPEYDISAAYDSIPDRLFNITVSHLPQLWPNITALGYGDLTLSGHVHSMQMKLRLGDRRFSPAQWMYEQWSGLYEERGRYLYINDGIGCVGFPMRLGAARPEITLITLRR